MKTHPNGSRNALLPSLCQLLACGVPRYNQFRQLIHRPPVTSFARLDPFGFTALFIERRSRIQGRIRDGESPGSGNCR
jgi:hypothetical protein